MPRLAEVDARPFLKEGVGAIIQPRGAAVQLAGRISMKKEAKKVSDREIEALELLVPSQASKATHSAYFRALSVSQRGVLCIEAGNLVRVAQDGSKIIVEKAKPRRKVTVDEVITVRKVDRHAAGGCA